MIAALFVETHGCYFGLAGVDPWDRERDARLYAGPHPVVAHPPCQRWGRFWHGSPSKPHQFKLGADKGCFKSALASVRQWGGVLEHCADSHAWAVFGLHKPPRYKGWVPADGFGGYTCYVEQGHYGHVARKPTWLYVVGTKLPELNWTAGAQRLDPEVLKKHGYVYARRRGMVSAIKRDDNRIIRNATPVPFQKLLISLARSVR